MVYYEAVIEGDENIINRIYDIFRAVNSILKAKFLFHALDKQQRLTACKPNWRDDDFSHSRFEGLGDIEEKIEEIRHIDPSIDRKLSGYDKDIDRYRPSFLIPRNNKFWIETPYVNDDNILSDDDEVLVKKLIDSTTTFRVTEKTRNTLRLRTDDIECLKSFPQPLDEIYKLFPVKFYFHNWSKTNDSEFRYFPQYLVMYPDPETKEDGIVEARSSDEAVAKLNEIYKTHHTDLKDFQPYGVGIVERKCVGEEGRFPYE